MALLLVGSAYSNELSFKAYSLIDKKIIEKNYRSPLYILVVEDNCSICEVVLKSLNDLKRKELLISARGEPSFRWRTRHKNVTSKWQLLSYESTPLKGIKLKGTPSLVVLNGHDEPPQVYYGKTEISQVLGL